MDNKTLAELQAKFPLIGFSRDGKYVKAQLSQSSYTYVDNLDEKMLSRLADAQSVLEIKKFWHDKYPGIYFYVGEKDREPSFTWVCRNGRDAESTGYEWNELKPKIEEVNQECLKANQPGWFYCSECRKAYPKSEYGYFYFTDTRCKKCVAENPAWLKRAKAETYD